MRKWLVVAALCVTVSFTASAQRKVNKMNGLSETTETKKKYNKQWIKLRNHGLPKASFSIGANASRVSYLTTESQIDVSQLHTFFSMPYFAANFAPSENFGFNLGVSYRRGKYYYASTGNFANGSTTGNANGNWQQNFVNLGINAGFTYYGNISKTIRSCSGFGNVPTQLAHFYWENGIIYAPSLVNEVLFVGSFNHFENGELVNSGDYDEYTIMYNGDPRRSAMLFGYSRMGIRFQNRKIGFRFGPTFEYQLNSNRGLVNDFTANQTNLMTIGLLAAIDIM